MMVVTVTSGATLGTGVPRRLFEGNYIEEQTGQGAHNYDVSGDGRRFLMMAPVAQGERADARPQMIAVQHWFEELKRLVPVN
jgi:hypothetical protein